MSGFEPVTADSQSVVTALMAIQEKLSDVMSRLASIEEESSRYKTARGDEKSPWEIESPTLCPRVVDTTGAILVNESPVTRESNPNTSTLPNLRRSARLLNQLRPYYGEGSFRNRKPLEQRQGSNPGGSSGENVVPLPQRASAMQSGGSRDTKLPTNLKEHSF